MILGFSRFGPEQILARLHLQKARAISVCDSEAELLEALNGKARNIVIMQFAHAASNMFLLRKSKKNFFCFGHQFELARWNIGPVDIGYDSIMDIEFVQENVVPILPRKKTPALYVLKKVEQSSLLGRLMSIIYELPSKTGQGPVRITCLKWLCSDLPLEALEAQLSKQCSHKPQVLAKIMREMRRPVALRLKAAMQEFEEGMDIDELAEKHQVKTYEISYVWGSLTRKKNATDEHVANTGE